MQDQWLNEYATANNGNETVILLTAHIASPSIVSRLYSASSTKRDVSIPEGKEHIVIAALYMMEMDTIGLYERKAARFVQSPFQVRILKFGHPPPPLYIASVHSAV